MHLKRILMSAADAGGGTAAPPAAGAPPASPTTPPAQPPAQGPVDIAAIARGVSDGVFAELRRAGVLKQQSTTPARSQAAPAGDPPATPLAATPLPDPLALRALDRALGRTGWAVRLDGDQYARVERNFIAESPDPQSAETWVTDYFKGWGAAASSPPPAANGAPSSPPAAGTPNGAPRAPAPQGTPPVSSAAGGAPPAPQVPLEERQILTMSNEERAALTVKLGPKGFMELFRKQRAAMGGARVPLLPAQ